MNTSKWAYWLTVIFLFATIFIQRLEIKDLEKIQASYEDTVKWQFDNATKMAVRISHLEDRLFHYFPVKKQFSNDGYPKEWDCKRRAMGAFYLTNDDFLKKIKECEE
jgi:hypothetical protein